MSELVHRFVVVFGEARLTCRLMSDLTIDIPVNSSSWHFIDDVQLELWGQLRLTGEGVQAVQVQVQPAQAEVSRTFADRVVDELVSVVSSALLARRAKVVAAVDQTDALLAERAGDHLESLVELDARTSDLDVHRMQTQLRIAELQQQIAAAERELELLPPLSAAADEALWLRQDLQRIDAQRQALSVLPGLLACEVAQTPATVLAAAGLGLGDLD